MLSVIDLRNLFVARLTNLAYRIWRNRYAGLLSYLAAKFPSECGSLPSLRNLLPIGVCELGGRRAHPPASTLPIGMRIVCRDGLVVDAVPGECGTRWYACHVLGFDYRD